MLAQRLVALDHQGPLVQVTSGVQLLQGLAGQRRCIEWDSRAEQQAKGRLSHAGDPALSCLGGKRRSWAWWSSMPGEHCPGALHAVQHPRYPAPPTMTMQKCFSSWKSPRIWQIPGSPRRRYMSSTCKAGAGRGDVVEGVGATAVLGASVWALLKTGTAVQQAATQHELCLRAASAARLEQPGR